MDTNNTTRNAGRLLAAAAILYQLALAQTVTPPAGEVPAWRKLGNNSVGLSLAGPAGGPVDIVWFSPTDNHLFARARSGMVFETADFTNWTISKNAVRGQGEFGFGQQTGTSPEPGARIEFLQSTGSRLYALGINLWVSDDGERTWSNLTAYNRQPVIGANQHSVAVSPQGMVVANDFGVWRSTDGGLSWSSLNANLPNLPMRRLLPAASRGTLRAEVKGIGVVELPPAAAAAHANWIPASDPNAQDTGDTQRRDAGKTLGTEITAMARTATVWIAGSIDGRLWTASDGAVKNWTPADRVAGRIEAIEPGGDPAPHSALVVAASGSGLASGPRLLRTIDDGATWDDMSAGLPDGPLHGVAVDAAAGIAYIAGDRGVFAAHVDMNSLAPVAQWQAVAGLPEAPAMDVRLDKVRNTLYVALDGYGLYAAPAPYQSAAVRVLTAADQPAEAAAPGVLLHVQGSGLSSVKSEGGDLTVLTSSQSSAQVQVPFEASGSTLALTVDSAQGQSRLALPLKNTAPAILLDGDGLPILVDAASGLTLDARNMAHPGSRIQVFAAGLGKVDPDWRAGVPAPAEDPPVVSARVEARLNGNALEVTRATLAPGYVGLYLVEVQLPGLVDAGAADFSLVVNGEASNRVKILLAVD